MMIRKLAFLGLSLATALTCASTRADMIELGAVGADGVYVHWIGMESGQEAPDSMRAAITVEPMRVADGALGSAGAFVGDATVLPMEATVSTNLATGEVQLTRFKASLLRAAILQQVPVEVLSGYRDEDRGIDWGADLMSFRVPVKILKNGDIVLLPGAEFGIRHYGGAVDATTGHFSAVLDARASVPIIRNWLSIGALGRVQYDFAGKGMSGDEESAMGFLAVALDGNNRFAFRLYGGVEHDSNRPDLGMPGTDVFVGAGIYGNLGAH